ncbi:ATP-binding protein [Streptomyces sp. AV19]|uniref:ATP-binding protein n=1 Tax=Streptomyces sp. AV19 TaxID=2793068 RepID=UPI0018FE8FE5|nr:ATP-binding protein [Streptomyces sp. AV19]MBH1934414.1 ATP-binding protein [Streptomyces sp. AV19]MDG4536268.1 ATP-binding protein [Streptomyces sp. AV19]
MTTTPVRPPSPADALLARLDLLRYRVRRAVAAHAEGDPQPLDDPFRGLYVSDDLAPHLLRTVPTPLPPDEAEQRAAQELDAAERTGTVTPLRDLALSPLETDLLLVALAPDLDPRYERCYGYLNDDVTLRRATVGLALHLCGLRPSDPRGRAVLDPAGALRTRGLLEVRDAERPYLTRSLHVPDRVTDHLLGLGDPPPPPDPSHRLARRVVPAVGWDDLVLPERPRALLRDLARRVRYRERVLGDWAMRPGGGRGRGVSALFSGPSGTGKTLAAEVVAADLGLELRIVDLSAVVDKYIGETEKRLELLFSGADPDRTLLLFDEADGVFGKRSRPVDAHDRYANTTTAYLLQRLESFDGLTVLTTNVHDHIDSAFLRRLDLVVPFGLPAAEQRRALWDRCLGHALPRSPELDLELLADAFDLPGGAIRCCALTAAYRAAETGRPVGTGDLLDAVRDEYGKLGRYFDESVLPPG